MNEFIPFMDRLIAVQAGNTTALDLSDLALTTIPDEVFSLTQLTRLSVINNLPIDQLCDELVLDVLRKTTQQTRLIHPRIAQLEAIVEQRSQQRAGLPSPPALTRLPDAIEALENLEELELVYQQLDRLPEAISRLPRLRRLVLRGNSLTGLPASFTQLRTLQVLNIRDTQITTLPAGLAQMPLMQQHNARRQELWEQHDEWWRMGAYRNALDTYRELNQYGLIR